MFGQLDTIYANFLNHFPTVLHPIISIILFIILVVAIFQTIKKNFVWIILLIILLPASIPILESVWKSVMGILSFLLSSH